LKNLRANLFANLFLLKNYRKGRVDVRKIHATLLHTLEIELSREGCSVHDAMILAKAKVIGKSSWPQFSFRLRKHQQKFSRFFLKHLLILFPRKRLLNYTMRTEKLNDDKILQTIRVITPTT